jgi:gas vesicle protein
MIAWIGIIGTVVGALIGGGLTIFNAHLQTRRQAQQERRNLILSKLEELHEAITHLKDEHRKVLVLLMSGQGDDEAKRQATETRDLSAERIQMLVGFYAPELSKHLPKMLRESVDYLDTVITYVLAKRAGQVQKENSFDLVLSKREELDRTLMKIQSEVEDMSKKYI